MQQTEDVSYPQEFRYRIDFYWQAIAFYAVSLVFYALLRGTVIDGTFTLVVNDPIVVLLLILVVFSTVIVLGNAFMRRSIVVGTDSLTFRNRFRERTFTRDMITNISITRETAIKVPRAYRVITIRLRHRRRPLRIRPGLYERDGALVQALLSLKRTIAH